MDLSYGEAAEAFRAEVRAFLSLHWPPPSDMRGADLRQFIRTFRALAIDQGYLYRAIPKRYVGSGQPVDVIRPQVIREEFVRARAPMEVGGNGVNLTKTTLPDKGTEQLTEPLIRKPPEAQQLEVPGNSTHTLTQ